MDAPSALNDSKGHPTVAITISETKRERGDASGLARRESTGTNTNAAVPSGVAHIQEVDLNGYTWTKNCAIRRNFSYRKSTNSRPVHFFSS